MNKAQIEMYFESQLFQAWMPRDPAIMGMGYAILARKTMGGAIVGVSFLCDHYCLGVKDCLSFLQDEAWYNQFILNTQQHQDLITVEPGYMKKYVLDLVAWSKELGFFPHSDYRFCSGILKGIPVDENAVFHFGKGEEGTPLFINGPSDTPHRINIITNTLKAYEARTGIKTEFILGGGGMGDFGAIE